MKRTSQAALVLALALATLAPAASAQPDKSRQHDRDDRGGVISRIVRSIKHIVRSLDEPNIPPPETH
jgi:hypothetical protein